MRYNKRMDKKKMNNLTIQLISAGMDSALAQSMVQSKARRLKAAKVMREKRAKQLEERAHTPAHTPAHDIENPAQSESISDDVTPPTPVKTHGKKNTRTKKARVD